MLARVAGVPKPAVSLRICLNFSSVTNRAMFSIAASNVASVKCGAGRVILFASSAPLSKAGSPWLTLGASLVQPARRCLPLVLGTAFTIRSKQNLPALFGRCLTRGRKEVTPTLHLDGGFGELELAVELRDVETTDGVVKIELDLRHGTDVCSGRCWNDRVVRGHFGVIEYPGLAMRICASHQPRDVLIGQNERLENVRNVFLLALG